jgi:IS5 family transposase
VPTNARTACRGGSFQCTKSLREGAGVQRPFCYKHHIDEVERKKNRTKSSVRSKVEHVFAVMKLKFGFVKVRYRGLDKNANRLFVTCALVNLFLVRKRLLTATAA